MNSSIHSVGSMLDDFAILHHPRFAFGVSVSTAIAAIMYQPDLWSIIVTILAALVSVVTILATVLRMIRETRRARRDIERHEVEMQILTSQLPSAHGESE